MNNRTVGFIGLGSMGGAMAGRLADAGHPVAIYDVNQAAAAALVPRGATACGSALGGGRLGGDRLLLPALARGQLLGRN